MIDTLMIGEVAPGVDTGVIESGVTTQAQVKIGPPPQRSK
jgi:hypothetical protein